MSPEFCRNKEVGWWGRGPMKCTQTSIYTSCFHSCVSLTHFTRRALLPKGHAEAAATDDAYEQSTKKFPATNIFDHLIASLHFALPFFFDLEKFLLKLP